MGIADTIHGCLQDEWPINSDKYGPRDKSWKICGEFIHLITANLKFPEIFWFILP